MPFIICKDPFIACTDPFMICQDPVMLCRNPFIICKRAIHIMQTSVHGIKSAKIRNGWVASPVVCMPYESSDGDLRWQTRAMF